MDGKFVTAGCLCAVPQNSFSTKLWANWGRRVWRNATNVLLFPPPSQIWVPSSFLLPHSLYSSLKVFPVLLLSALLSRVCDVHFAIISTKQQMTYDRAWGRGASGLGVAGLLFLLAWSSFRSICASLYVSCMPIWHLLLGMSSPPPPPTSALQTPTLNCDRWRAEGIHTNQWL